MIWEHCEIGSTVEKIVFEFIQIYEVDEQTARRDIEHTLSSWVEMGLIAPTPE